MRPAVKRKLIFAAAAASTGLLGFLGYPAVKAVYPIKNKPTIIDDYVDLPTATADLTKEIVLPESVGTSVEIPVDISHWLLLSLLKSKNVHRRDRALDELARQRRWSDADCYEIAQALDRQDVVRLARTVDADIRLLLPPPSVEYIQRVLESEKIEKLIKSILRDLSDDNDLCSSCTNFYTNLSIRFRPDSNILAMSDLNQVDKMMHIESRKRKKTAYNEDVIRLKAVLNNIICGEKQALSMVQSGMLVALLYFRHKYKDDVQINGLLAQIVANLTVNESTKHYVFTNGWIRALVQYLRSDTLELSLPASKALVNLDEGAREVHGVYGNHIYLLSPTYRGDKPPEVDVIFVHGLVGSVFKSWRQGSIPLDEHGKKVDANDTTPTTELLPTGPSDVLDENISSDQKASHPTRCWPRDWIPEDVPGMRILAVDYPTALSNWRTDCDLNKDSLRQRAIHVMKQLEEARVGDRPTIWVAHSMGGLLVKQILVICDEYLKAIERGETPKVDTKSTSDSFKRNLLDQSKGVVFYSVPHKGSNLDWIERKNLQKLLMLTTEVIELQKGSTVLMDLHEKFLNLRNQDIKFLTFAENATSCFGVNKVVQWKGVLVHEDSLKFETGQNYVLEIDHAHTCKPHSKDAITYVKTLNLIKDIAPKPKMPVDERILPYSSFIP